MQRALASPARPAASLRAAPARRSLRVCAVKVGDKAPNFTLPDQNGKQVQLSKFFGPFGGKPVVLFFYPKDNTPGCTREAKAFRDAYSQLKKKGAEVFGISNDTAESHNEFACSLDLPYTLLADQGGKVRQLYGVPKDLFGLLDGRQTFVIGKDGVVKAVHNNQLAPESHVEEALKALA